MTCDPELLNRLSIVNAIQCTELLYNVSIITCYQIRCDIE